MGITQLITQNHERRSRIIVTDSNLATLQTFPHSRSYLTPCPARSKTLTMPILPLQYPAISKLTAKITSVEVLSITTESM